MMSKLKCYCVYIGDDWEDEGGCVYIAKSSKEAKSGAWEEVLESRFPDERAYLNADELDVDVSDLCSGEMEGMEGLKRGAYSWIDDNCPECGKLGNLTISCDFDTVMCSDCEEKRLDKECPLNGKIGTAECWEGGVNDGSKTHAS